MRRFSRPPGPLIGVALVGCLLAAGVVACSSPPSADSASGAFLTGWRTGTFADSLTITTPDGGRITGTEVTAKIKKLLGDLADRQPTLHLDGKAKVSGDTATQRIEASITVVDHVIWTYHTNLRMKLVSGAWQPIFEPAVVEPDLTADSSLAVRITAADRASVLDGTGAPLVSKQPVVHIGIEPDKITNQSALLAALGAAFTSIHLDIDLSGLPAAIKAAKPNAFVPVVTLRRPVYDQIRSKIHDLAGTVFSEDTQQLAPTSTFARALLGTVGPVTKERMDAKPGTYQIGDQVGFGGLQQAYDDRLRGTPGVSVVIHSAKPNDASAGPSGGTTPGTGDNDGTGANDGTQSGSPTADKVVFHTDPTAGQPIKTTLDVKTQKAAETALTGWAQNSSIVAIRVSDGALLAVANGPGAQGQDLALNAAVPPGSTFKTVTATHLLEAGQITPDTTVNCPQTLTVNGYVIHNAESEALGSVPLRTDFAKSCNTAFASLAPKLGPTGLSDTAKQLGVGIPWGLGIDCFTGKVSSGGDPTEQAAAAFGQGTTQVSPIAMAGVAAAVARGQWKQPRLVLDPAPTNIAPDQPALKATTVDALHEMMRAVVTSGTGVKVKNVPGAPIYGKTGTAEYDNNPAHTHSWFIGFRGDVAFAVFVENGGASTEAAVPIAGTFFTLLG